MHAISSYRGKTHKDTHKHMPIANTQTGAITIHCAAKLSKNDKPQDFRVA